MARTLLDSSEQALARHVLTQATQRHETIIAGGDHGLISLVGSSALLLAILHARDANTADAEQCLTVARRLATVLGADRNHHDTEFGPTNVAMHAVGVAVELGNGQQALDRAAHVRHPSSSPRTPGPLPGRHRPSPSTDPLRPRGAASPDQSRTDRCRRTRRITPRRRTHRRHRSPQPTPAPVRPA
ncbi:transcriptional regulatory domain protein [Mycobacterium xenopi 4042]|uniref:Transcriptional regulatory domain protein n=1 Tax=Mycobacterium xenopi 4042 TaxID=1299334 RepID=X8A8N0_MYCXE|nr:transcriptional regulatory domain protein [Mycobacterium xenopi 4042]